MNIQFPPKESCAKVWPQFVKWMDVKMSQDAGPLREPDDAMFPVWSINFRQHEFTFCPFCGIELCKNVPIGNKHP